MNVLGDMFGNMFKREEPKTDQPSQPFLGQTTPPPPEQKGFFSNFKNPFATGGKKIKQKKQKTKSKNMKKNKTKRK